MWGSAQASYRSVSPTARRSRAASRAPSRSSVGLRAARSRARASAPTSTALVSWSHASARGRRWSTTRRSLTFCPAARNRACGLEIRRLFRVYVARASISHGRRPTTVGRAKADDGVRAVVHEKWTRNLVDDMSEITWARSTAVDLQ